ncbi:MAG: lipid A deacylase LpxR family protein [Sphingomonadales bacterium]
MIRFLALLCAVFAFSGGAQASGDRVFTLTVDNDVLTPNDQYFTNGIRISGAFGERAQKPWMDKLADKIPFLSKAYNRRVISFSLGQNHYTPADTSPFGLTVTDRPYAGWLYGEMGIEVDREKTVDYFSVQLGVIGPASLADRTQRSYHRLINSPRPNGWENQLSNEPGLVVAYQRAFKNHIDIARSGLEFSSSPHLGIALGNVYTYAAVGWTFRFGQGFREENGPPPRISPALPGSNYFEVANNFTWYIFGAVEGRAVARNIFLDGNTFTTSHSVSKKHLVADFQFGIVVIVDGIRIAYTHVFRTREFDLQPGKHEFSSVSLGFRF